MVHFKNKIREARLQKKLTQKQLAQKITELGLKGSNTAIANWEAGLAKPDIDTLEALCKILNKDGNYFFDDVGISINTYYAPLINSYEKLNEIGKNKSIEYIKDLAEIPKYSERIKKSG